MNQQNEPKTFMEWVERHERAWGKDRYKGRPTLQQIIDAPVVVFWDDIKEKRDDNKYTVTLHQDLGLLNKHFARVLFLVNNDVPRLRCVRVFAQGKQQRITGLRVFFEAVNEEDS